ncbi:calcium/sodium antiporter [Croceicoccus marinus]|uniref:Calcium/sodium antiporter n=1 Tax=Croceicoccus marinus TaxID=450378 RepID=A0A7G6VZM4_9SPHN|nr:calcium/sodium antiporter [Croceicoccus marinus]QNE07189.1 calcium/sodium antiporter [Croceicoccus marinus]
MLIDSLFLLVGLVFLIGGGELLVRGAVRIAERLGLSPMLIGLTVVGMGTSMPELAASVQAALAGSPGIAVGNIVGSNIANALLILGCAALLSPFLVQRGVLRRDGGVGLAAAAALLLAGHTLGLGRLVGVGLELAMVAYVYLAFRQEKLGADHSAGFDKALAAEAVDPGLVPRVESTGSLVVPAVLFLAGLVLIVGGGSLLVKGAISIASGLGVSDETIGLTVVAVGTSLPELVTSAIAAIKRQGDIALGNVLGSNIYNILFIGGLTGIVAPATIPSGILGFDLPLLLFITLLVMGFAWTGGKLSRLEGALLVVGYAAYASFTAGLW